MNQLSDQLIAEAMQQYVDAISAGDLEAIITLFSADAVVIDPIGSEPLRGHKALREFYQTACDSVEKMVLDGSPRVRDNFGAAAMLAYPAGVDGTLVMETLDVMEFNDEGKITAMTAYWGDSNLRTL